MPAWDTAGQTHQSPSLVPIVQELIDRPGWASGNALVVLVSGTGRRTARSYDANPAKAPLLHIDYVPEDPACDDGNPRTYDFWDAGSASCLYDAAAADGAACSDGLYCSTGNVCSAGSCGLPIDCSFMDTQCAVGVCDEAADACIVGTESWFDTNWLFRKPITIDSTKIIGDLDDFPVLVSITDPDLAASARADGFDIAFTGSNGSTKLDHEIEKYDGGTGELVAWVRVRLSASQDKTIYMYYGNATAGDQQNATAVWNASYMSVHHMKESPDGSGGAGCDTTPTVYSAAVSTTYNVPAGCDTLTVKSWGAAALVVARTSPMAVTAAAAGSRNPCSPSREARPSPLRWEEAVRVERPLCTVTAVTAGADCPVRAAVKAATAARRTAEAAAVAVATPRSSGQARSSFKQPAAAVAVAEAIPVAKPAVRAAAGGQRSQRIQLRIRRKVRQRWHGSRRRWRRSHGLWRHRWYGRSRKRGRRRRHDEREWRNRRRGWRCRPLRRRRRRRRR